MQLVILDWQALKVEVFLNHEFHRNNYRFVLSSTMTLIERNMTSPRLRLLSINDCRDLRHITNQ